MALQIERLDHLVMTCADVEATAAFYVRVLGMTRETFGGGRIALRYGGLKDGQKINLHPTQGNDIGLLARVAMPGTEDLCFVTEDSPDTVIAHLQSEGVAVLEGPVTRTGALGPIQSVYFRDPDGNLVEVSSYADR